MVRTLHMNGEDARLYMAGLSLTRFIGFESVEDYCRNTVIAVGDLQTDEMVWFSNSIDRDIKHLEIDHTERFSDYFEHSVAGYVVAEHRPQADLFFSRAHLMHCYEQGILNDSISYPCTVADDTVYIRASFELERDDESGHVFATVVLIDVTRFHSERQALATAATRDTLTGALNRITAADMVQDYIDEHLDGPAGVAVLNIDSFRIVNERYGHEYGDTVLMGFVDKMREFFGKDVVVSRTSGDEFMLFFANTSKAVVERRLGEFASQDHLGFEFEGEPYRYWVSVGAAMYPENGYAYDELISQATEAMHTAKLDVDTHFLMFDEEGLVRHREQHGFAITELMANVPAAIMVYKAYGDENIVFANRQLIDMLGCDGLDDFMDYTGGRFWGMVHPDDRERVKREIWSQIRGVTHDNTDYCRYRVVTKDGQEKQVEDFGHLVDSDSAGKVFYTVMHELPQA